jgi:hypothetical protein
VTSVLKRLVLVSIYNFVILVPCIIKDQFSELEITLVAIYIFVILVPSIIIRSVLGT